MKYISRNVIDPLSGFQLCHKNGEELKFALNRNLIKVPNFSETIVLIAHTFELRHRFCQSYSFYDGCEKNYENFILMFYFILFSKSYPK